jgi:large subunit ribosomal protein L24
MPTSSSSPRRQRRALYNADPFERRKRMTAPLSKELRGRFKLRALPVRKGDTVRILAGSFVGREERIAKVDRRSYSVTLDNVTLKTAEEKMKPLSIRTAHLVITRLNLADPWRRRVLRVRDEEVTPEERGELPEPEETSAEGEAAPVGSTTSEPPARPSEAETPADEDDDEEDEDDEDDDEQTAAAPSPAPRRRSRSTPPEESP